MAILEELREFSKAILFWAYICLGVGIFLFGFGLKEIELLGKTLFFPLPTLNSFSVQFFQLLQNNMLPSGVDIAVINPFNAFLAQLLVSFFLAFVLTSPLLLWRVFCYISPALYQKEKKFFLKILAPSFFLFLAGGLFSYFLLIPLVLKLLYSFAINLGAFPLFTALEFVMLTLGIIFMVGIMFQIPILMVFLSSEGIVKKSFWRKHYHFAFLGFLFFSAIITPDGTGLTMLLLFSPLALLYYLGYAFSKQ